MTKSQNTKNEQQSTSEQLTEQFNHGLLPEDRLYYYRFKGEPDVKITTQYGLYCEEADNKKEIEVIDFVPSYSEYLALQSDSLAKNEAVEINAELEAENARLKEEYEKECKRADELEDSYWRAEKENRKLKELLKECKEPLEVFADKKDACDWCPEDLLTKIYEVLK